MTNRFAVGDRVRWNSEAGQVQGTITKVHTKDVDYKGHTRRCSPDDPAVRDQERQDRPRGDAQGRCAEEDLMPQSQPQVS